VEAQVAARARSAPADLSAGGESRQKDLLFARIETSIPVTIHEHDRWMPVPGARAPPVCKHAANGDLGLVGGRVLPCRGKHAVQLEHLRGSSRALQDVTERRGAESRD
jgi:hypothetical protein